MALCTLTGCRISCTGWALAGGLLAGALTLAAGLSSGGLFAIWAALAIAAALLVRKVQPRSTTEFICQPPFRSHPFDHAVAAWQALLRDAVCKALLFAYGVFSCLKPSVAGLLQVPVWAQAPLAAALATPVSLLMINGALSYNTHVLDKACHQSRRLGCHANPSLFPRPEICLCMTESVDRVTADAVHIVTPSIPVPPAASHVRQPSASLRDHCGRCCRWGATGGRRRCCGRRPGARNCSGLWAPLQGTSVSSAF